MKPKTCLPLVLLVTLFFLPVVEIAFAGSATWNRNPTSNDWNTAANWTPATVPNGPNDVATFASSNQPLVLITSATNVHGIVFTEEASAFTITAAPGFSLFVGDGGIANSSGEEQMFDTAVGVSGNRGIVRLTGNSMVTGPVVFNNEAALNDGSPGGETQFADYSSAGNALFINNGSLNSLADGGHTTFHNFSSAATASFICFSSVGLFASSTTFYDSSSADHATFTTNGFSSMVVFAQSSTAAEGTFINNKGGLTYFAGKFASAANGTFINNGGTVPDGYGGRTIFYDKSSAANALLIAYGGTNEGRGGSVEFIRCPDHNTGAVKIYGNGFLDLSGNFGSGTAIGSLEGDGSVILGTSQLLVGTDDADTIYSGVISEGVVGVSGSLSKVGQGVLTLTGASLYRGGTILNGTGALRVSNQSGSAIGTGAVKVNAGTLGGGGIIAGPVTVGTGSGTGAFLTPGVGASQPTTLTIQSTLTFNADATYIYKLNIRKAKADQVIASGITIESGAQFEFKAVANARLRRGKAFTVISNTSAAQITGTFANLPDNSTFKSGRNSFQVDYEGGDGNDLTLTVVP